MFVEFSFDRCVFLANVFSKFKFVCSFVIVNGVCIIKNIYLYVVVRMWNCKCFVNFYFDDRSPPTLRTAQTQLIITLMAA